MTLPAKNSLTPGVIGSERDTAARPGQPVANEQWRAVGRWPGMFSDSDMIERGRWWADRALAERDRESLNGGVPPLLESWIERRWITEPERVDA